MTSLFQPDFVHFVASNGYSNNFVFRLAEAAAVQYERSGISYLHSLLLSTILLFVHDETVAAGLNEQWVGTFATAAPPAPGSYADLLMMSVLDVCREETFWPSAICIFHMVAPHIRAFSPAVAARVMKLFELCVTQHRSLALLVVEALVRIVQNPANGNNGFLQAIVTKRQLFDGLSLGDVKGEAALAVIKAFIAEAVEKGVRKVQVAVKKPLRFSRHPHFFGGEIEKTWAQWSLVLFARAFPEEIQKIRDLVANP
jgi:hypothetical protein